MVLKLYNLRKLILNWNKKIARGCFSQQFTTEKLQAVFAKMILRVIKIIIFVAFLTRISNVRFRDVAAAKSDANDSLEFPNLLLQQKEKEGVSGGIFPDRKLKIFYKNVGSFSSYLKNKSFSQRFRKLKKINIEISFLIRNPLTLHEQFKIYNIGVLMASHLSKYRLFSIDLYPMTMCNVMQFNLLCIEPGLDL